MVGEGKERERGGIKKQREGEGPMGLREGGRRKIKEREKREEERE